MCKNVCVSFSCVLFCRAVNSEADANEIKLHCTVRRIIDSVHTAAIFSRVNVVRSYKRGECDGLLSFHPLLVGWQLKSYRRLRRWREIGPLF